MNDLSPIFSDNLGEPDDEGFRKDFDMNDVIRGAVPGSSVNAERERLRQELSGLTPGDRRSRIRRILNGPGTTKDKLLARIALDGISEREYGSIPE